MDIWICLAIALSLSALAALRWPNLPWKHIDLIYYPLAAIGVGLFYVATTKDRDYLKVQSEVELAKLKVDSIKKDNPVPPADRKFISIGNPLQILRSHSSLADVCSRSMSPDGTCYAHISNQQVLQTALNTLEIGGSRISLEQAARFCARFEDTITTFENEGTIDGDILSRVKNAHNDALQGKWGNRGSIGFFDDLNELEADLSSFGYQQKPDSVTDEIWSFVEDKRAAEAAIGVSLLSAFRPCYGAPDAVRDGSLVAYETRSQKLELHRIVTQAKAEQAKAALSEPSTAASFQLTWWPFILIAALALKFGKAVSSISLISLWGRVRNWLPITKREPER